jgi:ABC-type transport system substrate-binding protein
VACVVAVALLAGACGSGGDGKQKGASTDGGGEFSVSINEPEHLLPSNTNATNDTQVLLALFTGLIDYDPVTAQPVKAMAESITSTDQRTWTIKIKPGWTFHNSEPVTARSFVDAWNFTAYAPNANGNASYMGKIEGYDDLQGDASAKVPPRAKEMSGLAVVDDTTFTVRLEEPFSQFPVTLGYQAMYPLPRAALADPKGYEQAPIGNGPFMMDGSWRHDEVIRVKRFPAYQGPRPPADAIEFRIYNKVETAYRDLQGGDLDIATTIPTQELPATRREFGKRLIERQSSGFNYLGLPLNQPAFQRRAVRQALSLAIDRKAIIDAIFDGSKEPAYSLIAPVVPGSRQDACKLCNLDVAKAKALLAQGGGWSGTLHIWFAAGRDNEESMEAVANQLRQNLGISDVKFDTPEFAEFFSAVKAYKVTGPFRLSWLMDYPSPQSYLGPLYTSGSASNRTGYSNPEVDQLIAEGDRAPSVEASIRAYQAAEDVILEDMPLIPLWYGKTQAVHSERVERVVIDPFSRVRVQDVRVVG